MGGGGGGGQGGCERRIDVFVKISKKKFRKGVVRFRVDVNEELNFFCENSKKKKKNGRGGGQVGGGGGGGGGGGVRMDMNEELKFL